MHASIRYAAVPLFVAASFAKSVAAQTTGIIEGVVVDAFSGAVVEDAVVVATSPSLQGEQTAVTDAAGRFTIALLPVGTYSLTVQRSGYQPFTESSAVVVRLDQTLEVKLSIVPEAVSAGEVVIVAQRPAIDVGSVQSGGIVTKEQMQLVPYGRTQRNFDAVLVSVPGVQQDLYGVAMRGSGSPEGQYIIDGVNVTDPSVGTQGTTLLQDFVEQVEVKTGGYQAEYGRSSGGIVNVVTKSGGNEFHGSIFVNGSPFELPRRPIVSAGGAIGWDESQRYSYDFGAEIGGPILEDRLWFFAGAAPQFGALNEDRLILARQDAGNGLPVVDSGGIPVVHEVARHRYLQTSRTINYAGKLTWLVNENHTIAAAAYGNPTTSSGALGTTRFAGNEGTFLYQQQTGATNVSLRYGGKLFQKRMLVEATVGYFHQLGDAQFPSVNPIDVAGASAETLRDTPLIRWSSKRNLLDPSLQDATTPAYQRGLAACQVQANGFDPCPVQFYLLGGVGGILTQQTQDRIATSLTLTNFFDLAGHHQVKYGAQFEADRFSQINALSGNALARETAAGDFQVDRNGIEDPGRPGFPLFDPANPGHLASEHFTVFSRNRFIAFFAQDTWSLFDRVVLDAGVRGEEQLMYGDPSTPDNAGNPIRYAQLKLFNVMPRLGILYDLTGRGLSKMYASYGRFYEFVPLDMATRALSNYLDVEYHVNPGACTPPPGAILPQDPRYCAVIPRFPRTYQFIGSGAAPIDPNLEGQYVDELQGGAQYQAYRNVVVAIDYVHRNVGRVIEDISVDDGNTYFISNPGEPGKVGYQSVTGTGYLVTVPRPRRVYDGITLSVRKNFSDDYLLNASYTYSSLRGNYPGLFRNENGQLDPNITSEYDLASLLPNRDGPLAGDVPNAFKVDGAYVRAISPSWTLQFGASFRASEGGPVNYLGGHPNPFYGIGESFILPRGSAGRLPWVWQIDARAAATRRLGSRYAATFSVDAINLTDNREVTRVNENYTYDAVLPIVGGSLKDLAYLKNTAGQPVTVNAGFRTATAYQLPLSVRLGARLSF